MVLKANIFAKMDVMVLDMNQTKSQMASKEAAYQSCYLPASSAHESATMTCLWDEMFGVSTENMQNRRVSRKRYFFFQKIPYWVGVPPGIIEESKALLLTHHIVLGLSRDSSGDVDCLGVDRKLRHCSDCSILLACLGEERE